MTTEAIELTFKHDGKARLSICTVWPVFQFVVFKLEHGTVRSEDIQEMLPGHLWSHWCQTVPFGFLFIRFPQALTNEHYAFGLVDFHRGISGKWNVWLTSLHHTHSSAPITGNLD